jgi:hypothetical protein
MVYHATLLVRGETTDRPGLCNARTMEKNWALNMVNRLQMYLLRHATSSPRCEIICFLYIETNVTAHRILDVRWMNLRVLEQILPW